MQMIHEDGKGFFALSDNGDIIGRLLYAPGPEKAQLEYQHTIVDEAQEGKGVGKALVDFGVAWAREHHLRIIPTCPFVAAIFKRNPEIYRDVIA